MAQSDQLRVPEPARTDAKSFELLRVWIAHQDQHISLRVGVWKEPEHWGMMLADLARHIAAAFEQSEKRDPDGNARPHQGQFRNRDGVSHGRGSRRDRQLSAILAPAPPSYNLVTGSNIE